MATTTTRPSEPSAARVTNPCCSRWRSSLLASGATMPARRASTETRCGPTNTNEEEHMGRLDERVAVITGGGEGIGKGIARRFAEEGARVLIAEVDEERGRTTADELAASTGAETLFVRTDVGRKEDNVA